MEQRRILCRPPMALLLSINGQPTASLYGIKFFYFQFNYISYRAVINLEVGGSGGRDILFQSGPNNPWLVKYYKKHSKHPFASTLAEEIFQFGILPSDTDFRIFRDYGNIPGLDIAQFSNGYVYHTAFDSFNVVPGRSVQNTGENVLSLVKAFSNAPELGNSEFVYFCYLFYIFLVIFFPAMGRNRDSSNPDMLIALICAMGTFFALGFVVPLINMFRWSTVLLIGLGVVTFIFCMISLSEVGFPYRPKTSVMRVNFLQTRRIFYEFDGSTSIDDSGYYFDLQDRHALRPLKDYPVNLAGLSKINPPCTDYVMCGMPCFWSSWCRSLSSAAWLPREQPVDIPGSLNLTLLRTSVLESGRVKRFELELAGPPHMGLYIRPLEGAAVEDWSFIRNMLDRPDKYSAPYQIYFSYGLDKSPFTFHIDFTKSNGNFNEAIFELGVVGHYVNQDFKRDETTVQFIRSLPDFVHTMEWPSLFVRFIF
nr:endoplasmic reticulum metallopeptidase 1 isoform X2 [Drosophila kikkawai]